ncbi:MAG: hypothetical protein HY884_08060 [Deltaproteobacteria bacterium]|nr:hypothetical protein [Deltaproteobacteria bacterium]
MLKNPELIRKLEDKLSRREGALGFDKASRIFTAMWKEAVSLGVLPPKDPLEGIEADIRLAAVLNSCSKNSSRR